MWQWQKSWACNNGGCGTEIWCKCLLSRLSLDSLVDQFDCILNTSMKCMHSSRLSDLRPFSKHFHWTLRSSSVIVCSSLPQPHLLWPTEFLVYSDTVQSHITVLRVLLGCNCKLCASQRWWSIYAGDNKLCVTRIKTGCWAEKREPGIFSHLIKNKMDWRQES